MCIALDSVERHGSLVSHIVMCKEGADKASGKDVAVPPDTQD